MQDENDLKTRCLDIMQRCRKGLALPNGAYIATYYSADSLICLFRHEDEKLYRIEIREVRYEKTNIDSV